MVIAVSFAGGFLTLGSSGNMLGATLNLVGMIVFGVWAYQTLTSGDGCFKNTLGKINQKISKKKNDAE